MVYEVPRSKKSLKQNQFTFKLEGKTYSIPLMRYLKPSVMEQMTNATAEDSFGAARALFASVGHPDLLDQFEDSEQLDALMSAWQEASGITVGESESSSV